MWGPSGGSWRNSEEVQTISHKIEDVKKKNKLHPLERPFDSALAGWFKQFKVGGVFRGGLVGNMNAASQGGVSGTRDTSKWSRTNRRG